MKALFLSAVALTMLSAPAYAQRYDGDRDSGSRYERDWRDGNDRGDRWRRNYREGDVVPYEFRQGGRYIHYEWRSVGLRRPPTGYAWMRINDQFLLAHQHTGRIIDVRRARSYRTSY